ncbi:MAG: hypothetical protein MRK02_17335 [Candidatus Scalindua sp.]|nr:hypothetical protein [Candidatus Scalindua sp.]
MLDAPFYDLIKKIAKEAEKKMKLPIASVHWKTESSMVERRRVQQVHGGQASQAFKKI